MKCSENECTPQGTCIYSELVTFRYKKYYPSISVGFRGFSHGLVTFPRKDKYLSSAYTLPDTVNFQAPIA